jgi:predicted GTPase
MNADSDSRSRLCPDHRSDSISSQSCVACAQARRIAELEQTVERLAEHVEERESDAEDDAKKPIQIAIPESESP